MVRLRSPHISGTCARIFIAAGIRGLFSAIKGLRNQIINDWRIDAHTIAETTVTYHRLDDKCVTVPVMSI